jgi:hypothetical protein
MIAEAMMLILLSADRRPIAADARRRLFCAISELPLTAGLSSLGIRFVPRPNVGPTWASTLRSVPPSGSRTIAFDTQSTTRASGRTHARVGFIQRGLPARCRRAQHAGCHARPWQHHLLGDWQTHPYRSAAKMNLPERSIDTGLVHNLPVTSDKGNKL